jgi:heat shock protein HtpX
MKHNLLRLAALLVLLSILFMLPGYLIGGAPGMLIAGGLALVVCGLLYWHADTLILHMSGARELHADEAPHVLPIVADLAQRVGLPMPRTYIIDSPTANAFATGRTPAHSAVVVTTGITHLLTREELAGVIAHELAHIKHLDTATSVAVAALASIMTAAAGIGQGTFATSRDTGGSQQQGSMVYSHCLSAPLLFLMTPLAIALIRFGLPREHEYIADKRGAAMLGDPLPLASALEKIEWAATQVPLHFNPGAASLYFVNPLHDTHSALRFFSAHPPAAHRVGRLRLLARQERVDCQGHYRQSGA